MEARRARHTPLAEAAMGVAAALGALGLSITRAAPGAVSARCVSELHPFESRLLLPGLDSLLTAELPGGYQPSAVGMRRPWRACHR